jgi:hypothetical protein
VPYALEIVDCGFFKQERRERRDEVQRAEGRGEESWQQTASSRQKKEDRRLEMEVRRKGFFCESGFPVEIRTTLTYCRINEF